MSTRIPRPNEKPSFLLLYIGPQRRLLRVVMKPEGIVIGRNTSDTEVDVDMTAHHGIENGVSREHVVISPKRDHFVIKDLDTVNSTWVNKRRLRPMLATDLYHGDVIRLAELRIEVRFAYEDDFIDNLDTRGSTKRLGDSEMLSPPSRQVSNNKAELPAFDTQVPDEQEQSDTKPFDDETPNGQSSDYGDLDLDQGVTKRFDD